MSNKKKISTLAGLGIGFAVFAVVLAIIIYTGANHPPLRYPEMSRETVDYILNTAKKEHGQMNLNLSPEGPFKWDNKNDIGAGKEMGVWANEFSPNSIVYYRRDKDAVWQDRARNVVERMSWIADELSDLMGVTCCSADSANGRKLPVYLPETGEEYARLVMELSKGTQAPNSVDGCSFIQLGPLGCQNRGIVIHPDLFTNGNDFVPTLRREMARYAYYSSVDYNQDVSTPSWFSEGFISSFSENGIDINSLSKDLTDFAEKALELKDSLNFRGNTAAEIGASFIQMLLLSDGDAMTTVIKQSLSNPLDVAFSMAGVDFNEMKSGWLQGLRSLVTEEGE